MTGLIHFFYLLLCVATGVYANGVVKYNLIGCYKDTSDRAIPLVERQFHKTLMDWNGSRSDPIMKCARIAKTHNYKVFAIQNSGQCATGPNAHITYDKHGPSTACNADGEGGWWANSVYGIDGYLREFVNYAWIGCFKDTEDRAIPIIEGEHPTIKDNYKERKDAINKCARIAAGRNNLVFSVQHTGQCATGPNAHNTYDKHGPSTACGADGEGGYWSNSVYLIEQCCRNQVEHSWVGCYRDTSDRAIPIAEGEVIELKDQYNERQDAIGKCARFAASQNYKVFSVQNGGQCATGPNAHSTYAKHGVSTACAADGKGGVWANAVYKF